MSREAMKQALEALEWNLPVIEDYGDKEQLNRQHKAITALRQALDQPAAFTPEIAAILNENQRMRAELKFNSSQHEWVGLTDGDAYRILEDKTTDWMQKWCAIEAKLKEKNHG